MGVRQQRQSTGRKWIRSRRCRSSRLREDPRLDAAGPRGHQSNYCGHRGADGGGCGSLTQHALPLGGMGDRPKRGRSGRSDVYNQVTSLLSGRTAQESTHEGADEQGHSRGMSGRYEGSRAKDSLICKGQDFITRKEVGSLCGSHDVSPSYTDGIDSVCSEKTPDPFPARPLSCCSEPATGGWRTRGRNNVPGPRRDG
jgi:hypothetical protein